MRTRTSAPNAMPATACTTMSREPWRPADSKRTGMVRSGIPSHSTRMGDRMASGALRWVRPAMLGCRAEAPMAT